jgi:pyrimidine-specific ribonucleoside hydrolase
MKKKWIFPICTALILPLIASCVPAGSTPSPSADEAQPSQVFFLDPSAETIPALSPEEAQPSQVFFPDPSAETIPVIYSHGGGPCDIGGMTFFAMHPNVDLIGVVFTRGEIHPEIALENWSVFLYDVLGSTDTAVAVGSQVRLDKNPHDFPEEWRRLADDFWGLDLPEPVSVFEPLSGPQMIVDLVNRSPKKVTLVAMASMIDIALALQQDPGILDNIAQVVIMGGAFTVPGNLAEGPEPTNNTVAEWNIYIDAQAARVLFQSGVPLSIVPLDAIQYLVRPEDVAVMNAIDDPRVAYIARMWNQQLGWSQGSGFLIWDTITATAVTNPENFLWTYDSVDVITDPGDSLGQTIALNNGTNHTRYATGADYPTILELLFDTYQGAASPSPAKPTDPEPTITGLAGSWEGFTGKFHIVFHLGSECKLHEKCGTFEIPEFSLSGDVFFVSVDGTIYEFEVANLSSGQPSANYEYLQLLEDGRLFYSTTGSGVTSEAFLERK